MITEILAHVSLQYLEERMDGQSSTVGTDYFWHRQVHQRLGEKLHYYIVRARPLDSHEIVRNLKATVSRLFGSIHVFPIYGSYDVLIRIWLHPINEAKFRHELSHAMVQAGEDRRIHVFTVDTIEQSWYEQVTLKDDDLRALNESLIMRVQDGEEPDAYNELRNKGLILKREQSEDILFFLAIQLRHEFDDEHAHSVALAIRDSLAENSEIRNASIYRGSGYCSVLVRAETTNYFAIGSLSWIRERFHALGATTETYLVQTAGYVFAEERIGQATFSALQGRDLLVQAILPELYDAPFAKGQAIKRFIDDEVRQVPLTDKDRDLLHDYLLGRLDDNAVRMMTVLFTFFVEIEQCLRGRYQEFACRQSTITMADWYQRAGLTDIKKNPAIGDVLRVTQEVIKATKAVEFPDLINDWEDLAKLRNEIAHGGVDILAQWDSLMHRLLRYLPRLRRLLPLIGSVTGRPCYGAYFAATPDDDRIR